MTHPCYSSYEVIMRMVNMRATSYMILFYLAFLVVFCCAKTEFNVNKSEKRSCKEHHEMKHKIFTVVNEKVNWYKARASCEALKMKLAIINSQKEQDNFASSVRVQAPQIQTLWIGLNDLAAEGQYVWTDGSSSNYTNWYPEQPDNYKELENCVNVLESLNYQWNDVNCVDKHHFVCQEFV